MKLYLPDDGSIRTDTWSSIIQNNKCSLLESNNKPVIIYESYWIYSSSSFLDYYSDIPFCMFGYSLFLINFALAFKLSLVQNFQD